MFQLRYGLGLILVTASLLLTNADEDRDCGLDALHYSGLSFSRDELGDVVAGSWGYGPLMLKNWTMETEAFTAWIIMKGADRFTIDQWVKKVGLRCTNDSTQNFIYSYPPHGKDLEWIVNNDRLETKSRSLIDTDYYSYTIRYDARKSQIAGDIIKIGDALFAVSCHDEIRNGEETGIDCGGSCDPCDPCPIDVWSFGYLPCTLWTWGPEGNCINGNQAYDDLNAAHQACGQAWDCTQIMRWSVDGKFYLRGNTSLPDFSRADGGLYVQYHDCQGFHVEDPNKDYDAPLAYRVSNGGYISSGPLATVTIKAYRRSDCTGPVPIKPLACSSGLPEKCSTTKWSPDCGDLSCALGEAWVLFQPEERGTDIQCIDASSLGYYSDGTLFWNGGIVVNGQHAPNSNIWRNGEHDTPSLIQVFQQGRSSALGCPDKSRDNHCGPNHGHKSCRSSIYPYCSKSGSCEFTSSYQQPHAWDLMYDYCQTPTDLSYCQTSGSEDSRPGLFECEHLSASCLDYSFRFETLDDVQATCPDLIGCIRTIAFWNGTEDYVFYNRVDDKIEEDIASADTDPEVSHFAVHYECDLALGQNLCEARTGHCVLENATQASSGRLVLESQPGLNAGTEFGCRALCQQVLHAMGCELQQNRTGGNHTCTAYTLPLSAEVHSVDDSSVSIRCWDFSKCAPPDPCLGDKVDGSSRDCPVLQSFWDGTEGELLIATEKGFSEAFSIEATEVTPYIPVNPNTDEKDRSPISLEVSGKLLLGVIAEPHDRLADTYDLYWTASDIVIKTSDGMTSRTIEQANYFIGTVKNGTQNSTTRRTYMILWDEGTSVLKVGVDGVWQGSYGPYDKSDLLVSLSFLTEFVVRYTHVNVKAWRTVVDLKPKASFNPGFNPLKWIDTFFSAQALGDAKPGSDPSSYANCIHDESQYHYLQWTCPNDYMFTTKVSWPYTGNLTLAYNLFFRPYAYYLGGEINSVPDSLKLAAEFELIMDSPSCKPYNPLDTGNINVECVHAQRLHIHPQFSRECPKEVFNPDEDFYSDCTVVSTRPRTFVMQVTGLNDEQRVIYSYLDEFGSIVETINITNPLAHRIREGALVKAQWRVQDPQKYANFTANLGQFVWVDKFLPLSEVSKSLYGYDSPSVVPRYPQVSKCTQAPSYFIGTKYFPDASSSDVIGAFTVKDLEVDHPGIGSTFQSGVFTLIMDVFLKAGPDDNQILLSFSEPGPYNHLVIPGMTSPTVSYQAFFIEEDIEALAYTFEKAKWQQLVVVANGSSTLVYIDGKELFHPNSPTNASSYGKRVNTVEYNFDPEYMVFGCLFDGRMVVERTCFRGVIEDMRVFSTALSATELTMVYGEFINKRQAVSHCTDGILNAFETQIDCGGGCVLCSQVCIIPVSCNDGKRNGYEEGIDCGGICSPCPAAVPPIYSRGEIPNGFNIEELDLSSSDTSDTPDTDTGLAKCIQSGNFAISFMAKTDGVDDSLLVNFYSTSATDPTFSLSAGLQGTGEYKPFSISMNDQRIQNLYYPPQTWTKFTLSVHNGVPAVWLNCELVRHPVTTAQQVMNWNIPASQMYFGPQFQPFESFGSFKGKIRNLTIWDRSLSETQVHLHGCWPTTPASDSMTSLAPAETEFSCKELSWVGDYGSDVLLRDIRYYQRWLSKDEVRTQIRACSKFTTDTPTLTQTPTASATATPTATSTPSASPTTTHTATPTATTTFGGTRTSTPTVSRYTATITRTTTVTETATATKVMRNCVGDWGPFTPCSKTCDGGTTTRTYEVIEEEIGGGLECPHETGDEDTHPCNGHACPNCPSAQFESFPRTGKGDTPVCVRLEYLDESPLGNVCKDTCSMTNQCEIEWLINRWDEINTTWNSLNSSENSSDEKLGLVQPPHYVSYSEGACYEFHEPIMNVRPMEECVNNTRNFSLISNTTFTGHACPEARRLCRALPDCVGIWSSLEAGCIEMRCQAMDPYELKQEHKQHQVLLKRTQALKNQFEIIRHKKCSFGQGGSEVVIPTQPGTAVVFSCYSSCQAKKKCQGFAVKREHPDLYNFTCIEYSKHQISHPLPINDSVIEEAICYKRNEKLANDVVELGDFIDNTDRLYSSMALIIALSVVLLLLSIQSLNSRRKKGQALPSRVTKSVLSEYKAINTL